MEEALDGSGGAGGGGVGDIDGSGGAGGGGVGGGDGLGSVPAAAPACSAAAVEEALQDARRPCQKIVDLTSPVLYFIAFL